MNKVFISCALPYANGPCHLGHLRSTYVPADIYARYNRMNGNKVLFVCASDEHGTPIAVMAEKEGKKPIEIAKRYHDMIANDLESCDISFNNFSRTSDKAHYDLAQNFFLNLYNKGLIYEKEISQLYCEECQKFLPDRYVIGECPHCGGEGARGDHCEVCGRHLEPTELKNPKCLSCTHDPVIKESSQYFFKLSNFQNDIENYIENTDLPANVKNYSSQWLKEGLKDWILSRDMDWGIPIPLENAKGKIIYVWGEAFLGYISSASQWAKKINTSTKESNVDSNVDSSLNSNECSSSASNSGFDSDSKVHWEDYWDDKTIHFIGKDIIYHHAIFWTSLLDGYGCKLPTNIIAGEYLSLEGRKMSTSQNWVIWVKDFVKKYDSDLLRYYLTVNAPLNKDTDFSWDDFQRRINDELADVLGNFLHRSFVFTHKFFDGKIPTFDNPSSEDLEFQRKIDNISDTVGSLIEEFKFREGLVEIIKIAKAGNKYFNDKEPWKAVKEDEQAAANCIHLCIQLSKKLAIMLIPYIPKKAKSILDILNLDILNISENLNITTNITTNVNNNCGSLVSNSNYYQWGDIKLNNLNNISWNEAQTPLEVGQEIKKAKPLFKKIEDEVIANEKELLYKSLETHPNQDEKSKDKNKDKNKTDDSNKNSCNISSSIKNGENSESVKKSGNGENMKDMIDIDDFMKLDIRIGEIIEAVAVEKSEKLLKLKVNIGEKEIQVVAGIAKKYSPEELLNRQVIVLVNLKPAKLFGIKSEGMLLATDSASLLKADDSKVGESIG